MLGGEILYVGIGQATRVAEKAELLLRQPGLRVFECFIEAFDQTFVIKWFGQKAECPRVKTRLTSVMVLLPSKNSRSSNPEKVYPITSDQTRKGQIGQIVKVAIPRRFILLRRHLCKEE